MPTLPAVAGLLKHHVYHRDPRTGAKSALVTTFWTWRNETPPVDAARVTYEATYLHTWVGTAQYRATVTTNEPTADFIKTWDMGTTPPTRRSVIRVWPIPVGTAGSMAPPQLCGLIALRTQPVGSATLNRLNGRIYHSRFMPPASNFVYDTAQRNVLKTAYDLILANLSPAASANSGDWVVPCWWEGGALRVGGPLLPPVDHLIVRDAPAVRRSKLFHHGGYGRGA